MAFSDHQARALRRGLRADAVRTRQCGDKTLSYIEGWHAIAEANRIFGPAGWDRETLEVKCVTSRANGGMCSAIYTAKVRITVRAGDAVVVREGHGTSEGRGATAYDAHDMAMKGAETDGTKRALATFGKPFGLALYVTPRRRQSSRPPRPATAVDHAAPKDAATAGRSGDASAGTAAHADRHDPPGRLTSMAAAARPRDVPTAAAPLAAHDDGPGSDDGDGPDGRMSNGSVTPARTAEATAAAVVTRSRTETEGERTGGEGPARPSATVAGRGRAIDKSALTVGAPLRVRDKLHLRFVADQPCLLCSGRPSDPHHLRFAQPRALGAKAGDQFTVPLCRAHHRGLHHSGSETAFWHDMGIDALSIAADLWHASGGAKRDTEDRGIVSLGVV